MAHRSAPWHSRYARWFSARPQTVVVQPTTFCNLDCTYCYLPHRRLVREMSPEIAGAVARSVTALTNGASPLGIVWHGGEPLALGLRKFTALLALFEDLRQAGAIHHYVQTNATLITDNWCDLLTAYEFRVGVSIDGPATHNAERVDLRGRSTFERVTRGIRRLREHAIPFSVISVVGTDAIGRPEELLNFLATLGGHSVGFNIEETEGVNTDRQPPTQEQAEEFWRRTLAWSRHHRDSVKIREVERLGEYLRLIRTGQRTTWEECRLDPIPTVSWDGQVVLLSPELAGTTDATYNNFAVGNVQQQPIAQMLRDAHRLRYVREFLTGLDRCQAECEFFDFCRGAQAGNRYFENGSLETTETNYCRASRQALVTALSTIAIREETP
ncbi:cyclophane-forming radical SAM peptide maturase AmcB [Streptosporangium sp. NBC_01469]|uniref:cyclophane-forming radical SAM peptide maturase AmcB n=1 Tax=Streptosporangium sp. NBC_01469 TaxID=2903898 RepID=UPI002E29FE60|nr:cyclophane-forming radical SAM peptide maturase AmcB [Streptosporangium sp. NBC_01469]